MLHPVLVAALAAPVLAQAPAGYYAPVDPTTPATVRTTLRGAIDAGHTRIRCPGPSESNHFALDPHVRAERAGCGISSGQGGVGNAWAESCTSSSRSSWCLQLGCDDRSGQQRLSREAGRTFHRQQCLLYVAKATTISTLAISMQTIYTVW